MSPCQEYVQKHRVLAFDEAHVLNIGDALLIKAVAIQKGMSGRVKDSALMVVKLCLIVVDISGLIVLWRWCSIGLIVVNSG